MSRKDKRLDKWLRTVFAGHGKKGISVTISILTGGSYAGWYAVDTGSET